MMTPTSLIAAVALCVYLAVHACMQATAATPGGAELDAHRVVEGPLRCDEAFVDQLRRDVSEEENILFAMFDMKPRPAGTDRLRARVDSLRRHIHFCVQGYWPEEAQ